mgnify:FL=1
MKVLTFGKTYKLTNDIVDIINKQEYKKGSIVRVIDEKGSGYILEDIVSNNLILIDYQQSKYLK